MNAEIIKEENRWLLEAINEQFEAIQHHGEKPPRIEFDILMENVRKFYENLCLLRRMNESSRCAGSENEGGNPIHRRSR